MRRSTLRAIRSRVAYGDGMVRHLPELVRREGWRSILLVCGPSSFEASGAAAILPDLERAAALRRWSGFAPNPDSNDVLRGLLLMQEAAVDAIIGIGGGSAMDMAKLLCAYDGLDRPVALERAIRSGGCIDDRQRGLCLVPTTSGSGSEATHFAVVYIGEEKYSVGGPALYADQVVLDPSLARSGSAYQRAASGIDAVCQAVESLWARGATDVSRRCARRALELLLRHIEPFVEHATPDTARGMALGSHLAGRAIDISKTTAPHALSYVMSKRYGISHGHAVALTLGRFIALHAELQPHRLQRGVDPCTHRQAMSFILRAFNASDGLAADRAVEALMMRLGLEHRLEAIGLSGADAMERVARSVNLERLGNNPADLMQTDLFALLADPRVGAAIGIQIT